MKIYIIFLFLYLFSNFVNVGDSKVASSPSRICLQLLKAFLFKTIFSVLSFTVNAFRCAIRLNLGGNSPLCKY